MQLSVAVEIPESHSKPVAQRKENPGDSLTSSRRRQLFAIALDDSGFKTISEALLKNIGVRIKLEELGLFKPMSWPKGDQFHDMRGDRPIDADWAEGAVDTREAHEGQSPADAGERSRTLGREATC